MRQGASEHRHLVQLAIGINAMLQRKPRTLRIESGDGTAEGTIRLDLDRKGRATSGISADPLYGTYVHAEFGGGWFARFTGDTFTPEQGLVETRCRFTPVPILLNGDAPFGYKASPTIRGYSSALSRSFYTGGRRGVVSLESSALEVVVGGVSIVRKQVPVLGGGQPVGGVVCDDGLRKTADQSDIVQDRAWVRMLHAVQPLATELKQVSDPSYRPPPLPALPSEAAASSPAALVPEPLSPRLVQLGLRPDLTLDALRAFPGEQPLFWARPEDAEALESSADPARFPYPVLLLTPGQALTLDLSLPEHSVGRLATVADADFVRRMLGRHQSSLEVEVPWRPSPEDRGVLAFQLRLAGAGRAWSDPREGRVSVLVTVGGRTAYTGTLPHELPDLSLSLHLPEGSTEEDVTQAVEQELPRRALFEAWRAVVADEDGVASRPLLASLLASFALPQFVETEDGVRLGCGFPSTWTDEARVLVDRPLAADVEGRPISFEDLMGMQGTRRFREVADLSTLEMLAPLEEHLGYGHLHCAELAGAHLIRAARTSVGWTLLHPDVEVSGRVVQLLWIPLCPVPEDPGPGWEPVGTGVLGVSGAVRAGTEAQDPEPGLALIQQRLRTVGAREGWTRDQASGEDGLRRQGVARVVLLRLSAHLGRLTSDRILHNDRGELTPLKGLLAEPDRAVHPRHGALVDEPHTLALWLDELVAIRESLGAEALPLRFDDPPELWRGLLDDHAEDWVLRVPVDLPGLRGWLGLRRPFDATAGVFLQSLGQAVGLPDGNGALPCHGLLWTDTQDHGPTRSQLELLNLSRRQLYAELEELLGKEPEDADALAYSDLQVERRQRPSPRRRKQPASPSRTGFGSHAWRIWADCDPALKAGLPGFFERGSVDLLLEPGSGGHFASYSGGLGGLNLPRITLDSDHPIVQAAIRGPGPARHLCCLEIARLLAAESLRMGLETDLHLLHRQLVAGRVG